VPTLACLTITLVALMDRPVASSQLQHLPNTNLLATVAMNEPVLTRAAAVPHNVEWNRLTTATFESTNLSHSSSSNGSFSNWNSNL
jgi:hypothetical protein